MQEHTLSILLSRSIALVAFAAFPMAVWAEADFNVPSACTDGVTPDDDDELYEGLPPSVQLVAQDGTSYQVTGITRDKTTGKWSGSAFIIDNSQPYLVVATYTSFLQSYDSGTFKSQGLQKVVFPDPGYYFNPQYKLWKEVQITVEKYESTDPMPGAFLEMAPDLPGASPYTMQADSKDANITIKCFTALPAGNNITVFTPDHQFAYTANMKFKASSMDDEIGIGYIPGSLSSAKSGPASE